MTAPTPPQPAQQQVCGTSYRSGSGRYYDCGRFTGHDGSHLPCPDLPDLAAPSVLQATDSGTAGPDEVYRAAWDRWAAAVDAGASVDEQRPLWDAMNRTLDRAKQIRVLTAGITGSDCEIATPPSSRADGPTADEVEQAEARGWPHEGSLRMARAVGLEPPAEAQQDDERVPIDPYMAWLWATIPSERTPSTAFLAGWHAAVASRPSADTELRRWIEAVLTDLQGIHDSGDVGRALEEPINDLRAALDGGR